MVSPTGAPLISLIEAQTKPTCPESSWFNSFLLGVKTPIFSTECFSFFECTCIKSPFLIDPFTTFTKETTP